jgi:predicted GTPase
MKRRRIVIMGAAGRDFHDFNVVFRDDPRCQVVAFTAAQIPGIAGRVYPPSLAGPLYPDGIPIVPESALGALLRREHVHEVVFAYSDLSHEDVMHRASLAAAAGADFRLLGPSATMLHSSRPVVSVCAVRTGAGKSPVARHVANLLGAEGLRVALVRHPMPYGNLAAQAAQRFATIADLDRADCTIEEREEYEPHLAAGRVVYAGVDYARVLRLAESESDVILWEGGNNDLPFFAPDFEIVLVDPHRPGHERRYHPGETNLLRAHVVVVAKCDTAQRRDIEAVRASVREANPTATIVESSLPPVADRPELVRGKRVLVIEDGPTLTHGGMAYGAGTLVAQSLDASEIVDPRPFAVGSIRATLAANPHVGPALPAMGYGDEQVAELAQTIGRTPCDAVIVATPVNLARLIRIEPPVCRVTYEHADRGEPTLAAALRAFAARDARSPAAAHRPLPAPAP